MTHMNCALVIGQGRSGTNWLLDLLDLSHRTHCRNEPDELVGSPFSTLSSPTIQQPYSETFSKNWEQAIATAAMQMGYRDRIAANPKAHLRSQVSRLGGAYLLRGQRRRQIASIVSPSLAGEQWTAPDWMIDRQQLEQAYPIFKLNQAPGWAAWVLNHRPRSRVIHIMRHPGGFLNSWRNRYVTAQATDQIRQANSDRLKKIAAASPHWARRMGDIDAMCIDESELWYWCYANEVVYRAGQGQSNYHLIIYEDLVRSPADQMRQVYSTCGLPWTSAIESRITSSAAASASIAMAWKHQIAPAQRRLVDSILAKSAMANHWPPDINRTASAAHVSEIPATGCLRALIPVQ
ncbi:MAG: sulfotransferase [Elainellaceae cyanobacterium]